MSETLSGVTQLKIRDDCLYNMFGRTYVILYFDPCIFVFAWWSTPSQTSLNRILCLSFITRIILKIELFTVLNSFAGVVKTKKKKLTGIVVTVVS